MLKTVNIKYFCCKNTKIEFHSISVIKLYNEFSQILLISFATGKKGEKSLHSIIQSIQLRYDALYKLISASLSAYQTITAVSGRPPNHLRDQHSTYQL